MINQDARVPDLNELLCTVAGGQRSGGFGERSERGGSWLNEHEPYGVSNHDATRVVSQAHHPLGAGDEIAGARKPDSDPLSYWSASVKSIDPLCVTVYVASEARFPPTVKRACSL